MLTQLVDYDYYCDHYEDSSIPESSFDIYSKKATIKINYFTSNRIIEADDIIKDLICEMTELIYYQDKLKKQTEKQIKLSETVGPHSTTYSNNSDSLSERILSSKELDRECYLMCNKSLAHTGLMRRSFN